VTPFGARIRELRDRHKVTQKEMAEALQISTAYLSALEHGKRGAPSPMLVRQICGYFHIIWDEAEEMEALARVSHPKVTVDTAGLSPKATLLANRLAERIAAVPEPVLDRMLVELERVPARRRR